MHPRHGPLSPTVAPLQSYVPGPNHLAQCLSSWNKSWLSSELKYFIFRFRYNSLPLTNRVHNFDRDADPRCTFCRIRDQDTMIRESLSHCFFDCPTVHDIIYRFNMDFFGQADPDRIKSGFWYGTYGLDESIFRQSINISIWDIIRFTIFKFKSRRILPNIHMIKANSLFLMKTTIFRNRAIMSYMRADPWFANLLWALG
jgi:hypothetical protein